MCLQEEKLSGREDDFRQLYYMLSSIIHFEFHQIIESLKNSYAAQDPDTDTRVIDNKQTLSEANFAQLLGGLLGKANYEQISQQTLHEAMKEASLFRIRLEVDFSDYDEVLLYCRGVSTRKETIPTLG